MNEQDEKLVLLNLGVKDFNVKTLVTGDKQARIVLETLNPQDIPRLSFLLEKLEVTVAIYRDTLPDFQEVEEIV